MPVSIIDIDVNDEKFKKFLDAFGKFTDATKALPKGWSQFDKAADSTGVTFNLLYHDAAGTAKAIGDANRGSKQWNSELTAVERTFARIGRSASNIAKNIVGTTFSLSKWTSIGAGLMGVGGLWGLERLASGATSVRAGGLRANVSPATLTSFAASYDRYGINSSGLLTSVSDAMRDQRQFALFGQMGINPAGKTEDQLAKEVMAHAAQIARASNGNPSAMESQGIGQNGLVSYGDAMTLSRLSPKELQEASDAQTRAAAAQKANDSTYKAWSDLDRTLTNAKDKINTILVVGLERLAVPIEKLSAAFTEAVAKIIGSDAAKEGIEGLAGGLTRLANYIGSKEFANDLSDFGSAVSIIVKWLKDWAVWITGDDGAVRKNRDAMRETTSRGFDRWGFPIHDAPPGSGVTGGERSGTPSAGGFLGGGSAPPAGERGGINNWVGMKVPGDPVHFQNYEKGSDSWRAAAAQFRLYHDRDNLTTLETMMERYSPKSENDTAKYIAYLQQATGLKSGENVDTSNNVLMAKLVAAVSRYETGNQNIQPGQVLVTIYNKTGSDITTTTGAVAR